MTELEVHSVAEFQKLCQEIDAATAQWNIYVQETHAKIREIRNRNPAWTSDEDMMAIALLERSLRTSPLSVKYPQGVWIVRKSICPHCQQSRVYDQRSWGIPRSSHDPFYDFRALNRQRALRQLILQTHPGACDACVSRLGKAVPEPPEPLPPIRLAPAAPPASQQGCVLVIGLGLLGVAGTAITALLASA